MMKESVLGAVLLAVVLALLPLGDGLRQDPFAFLGPTLIIAISILAVIGAARSPAPVQWDHIDVVLLLYLGVACFSAWNAEYHYAAILRLVTIGASMLLYASIRRRAAQGGTPSIFLVGFTTIWLVSVYALVEYFRSGGRAHGLLADPNGLAAFANAGLAAVLPIGCRWRPVQSWVWRLALAAPLFAAVIFSQSRGALIGTLLLLGLMAARQRKLTYFFGGAALLAALVFLSPLGSKILDPRGTDLLALRRIDIYRMDLRMVHDHPAAGLGLGQFPWYASRYNFPLEDQPVRYSKIALSAHSDLLQAATELGVPGAFLFLVLMLCPVLALRSGPLSDDAFRVAAALVALNVHGLFHHLLLTDGLLFLWMALLALLPRGTAARSLSWRPSRSLAISVILALAALWLAGVWLPYRAARWVKKAERAHGDPAATQEALSRALELVPIQPYYHQAMAALYAGYFEHTGKIEALALAIDRLNEARRHNPIDWVFLRQQASLYSSALAKGYVTEEFLQAFRETLDSEQKLNPYSPVPLLEMARLDLRVGKIDRADRELRQALAIEPNFIRARYELRKVYKARSNWTAYDAETARLKDLCSRYDGLSQQENFREILSVPEEMRRELP